MFSCGCWNMDLKAYGMSFMWTSSFGVWVISAVMFCNWSLIYNISVVNYAIWMCIDMVLILWGKLECFVVEFNLTVFRWSGYLADPKIMMFLILYEVSTLKSFQFTCIWGKNIESWNSIRSLKLDLVWHCSTIMLYFFYFLSVFGLF